MIIALKKMNFRNGGLGNLDKWLNGLKKRQLLSNISIIYNINFEMYR